MKNSYKNLIILLLCFSTFFVKAATPEGHDIRLRVKGFKEGSTVILAYYYGDKQYIKDSSKVGPDGYVEFKGEEKYPQGIYTIIPSSKKTFDLVMDENQHYSIESDTMDYIQHMKIKGSEENSFIYSYQKFIAKQQKLVEPLRAEYKKVKDKDSIKAISEKINAIDNEVRNYKREFIKKNADSFVAKFFTAMEEPVIPEAPLLPNGKKDSLFPYHYYKTHFFDNIDFSDDRLLRTPLFHPKVKQYMEKMTPQMPDSINVSADYLIEKSRNNPEVFKWMVYWLTYTYESSQIMGMDAVFVHLVDKYYATHQTYWTDSSQLAKIIERAWLLKPILIGKKAPAITMFDSAGKTIPLYDVKAEYTVVIFWDQDCGHCKKEIPVLLELYNNKLKPMGIEVYGIASENKEKEWKQFIKEHKLHWINVHQPDDYKRAVTKKIYDIYSTPFIYLLDENKIIRAKHIAAEQLGDFIDILEKEKQDNKKQ